jgi:hypothetical protein
LKIYSFPTFTLKSFTKIFMWYFWKWSNTCFGSCKIYPSYHHLYIQVVCTHSKQYHTDLLVLYTTSLHYPLPSKLSWFDSLMYEKSVPKWLVFPLPQRNEQSSAGWLPPSSHIWPLVLPLHLTYTLLIAWYCFQWVCPTEIPLTFNVPNLIPFLNSLQRICPITKTWETFHNRKMLVPLLPPSNPICNLRTHHAVVTGTHITFFKVYDTKMVL